MQRLRQFLWQSIVFWSSFPFAGTFSIGGAERAEEDGVITKPGILGGLQDGNALTDLLRRLLEPFLADLLLHRTAIDLLEPVHT